MAAATSFGNRVLTSVGTALVDLYDVPTGKASTVIGLSIANVTEVTVNVNAMLYKSGTGNVSLGKNLPIPPGSSLVLFGSDQRLVMTAFDILKIQSDTTDSVDVVLSFLEILTP